jgi:hypothetical protein
MYRPEKSFDFSRPRPNPTTLYLVRFVKKLVLSNESMSLLKAPFFWERGWGEVTLAVLPTKPTP